MVSSGEPNPTLVLMNDELKNRLTLQRQASDRLDTKTTVVVGFVATAAQLIAAAKGDGVLRALALVAYAAGFVTAVFGIAPSKDKDVPEPEPFVSKYKGSTADEVLGALVGTRPLAFKENADRQKHKTTLWWASMGWLLLGVALSAASLWKGA